MIDEVKEALHIELNDEANNTMVRGKEGIISSKDSAIPVVVIPTDEEVMIARDIVSILKLK